MSKDQKYSSEHIEKTDQITHARMYPAMYISGKGEVGVIQTVKEVLSNSKDEAMAGHGKLIEVILESPTRITVRDHGRGIPIDLNKKFGETGLELCAQFNTGGKFDHKVYNTSGGMHGVGLAATAAVSLEMVLEVRQGGKIHQMKMSKGYKIEPKQKGKLNIIGECPKSDTGTTISWELDPTVMTTTKFPVDPIISMLRSSAFLTPGVSYKFIDKRDKKDIKVQEFLSERGMADFVDYIKADRKSIIDKTISVKGTMQGTDSYDIGFSYIEDYKCETNLYVNGNLTINGGTAVVGFRTGLVKAVNDVAKTLGLIKEKDKPFKASDIDEGLVAIIDVKMSYPELEGQTKNKLNNDEVRSAIYQDASNKLIRYFENDPVALGAIVSKCLLGRKAREASLRARELVLTKQAVNTLMGPTKLKDCVSKDPKECELYIVEGDSAAGGMLQVRDVRRQAYIGLKGKVLNVEKASRTQALENEEVRSLLQGFGCGFGEDFNIDKLRYHKIIILTDADPDGAHIRCLLLTFLFRYCPELIKQGYVYVCVPPLYKIKWGKDNIKYYVTTSEFEEAIAKLKSERKDFVSSRFKGLGEMVPPDLRDTCLIPENRTLYRITVNDTIYAEEVLKKLMSSEELESRKTFFRTKGEEL